MKTTVFSILIALLFTFACKKEEVEPPLVLPPSPQNEYDYAGERHNEILDHLITVPFTDSSAADSVFNESRNFYASRYTYDHSLDTLDFISGYESSHNDSFPHVVDSLFNVGGMSVRARDYLHNMYTLFKNSEDYSSLSASLVNLDNQITQDRLTEPERAAVLSTTSTARHSSYYWNQAMLDINNPWHEDINRGTNKTNLTEGKKEKWKKIKKVALADCIGLIIGSHGAILAGVPEPLLVLAIGVVTGAVYSTMAAQY